MRCKTCTEENGEVSVLDEEGDVVLLCYECADTKDAEKLGLIEKRMVSDSTIERRYS